MQAASITQAIDAARKNCAVADVIGNERDSRGERSRPRAFQGSSYGNERAPTRFSSVSQMRRSTDGEIDTQSGSASIVETRRIGTLEVSVIGLGCNNFGWKIDEDATRRVIDAAIDSGITFLRHRGHVREDEERGVHRPRASRQASECDHRHEIRKAGRSLAHRRAPGIRAPGVHRQSSAARHRLHRSLSASRPGSNGANCRHARRARRARQSGNRCERSAARIFLRLSFARPTR